MFGNHTQQEVEKYIAEQAGVESVSLVAFDPFFHGEVSMAKYGLCGMAVVFAVPNEAGSATPNKDGWRACLVPFGVGYPIKGEHNGRVGQSS